MILSKKLSKKGFPFPTELQFNLLEFNYKAFEFTRPAFNYSDFLSIKNVPRLFDIKVSSLTT